MAMFRKVRPALPPRSLFSSSPSTRLFSKSFTTTTRPEWNIPAENLDPRFIFRLPPEERVPHMKLLVCDMAGTTVNEGGLVYATLQKVMNDAGLEVSDEEMITFHGAQKTEVVAQVVMERLKLGGLGDGGSSSGGSTTTSKTSAAQDGLADGNQSYYSFRPWSSKYGGDMSSEDAFKRADAPHKSKLAGFIATYLDKQFEIEITEAYFSESGSSNISLIHPDLLDFFADIRAKGCKVALNTGYPKKIQTQLVEKLGLKEHVDAFVCAGEVGLGRPYPYMVQLAMKQCEILDAKTVAKAGDTSRDIEEGLNGGCGLAIGVLTGAGTEEGLREAGADLVLKNITEFGKMM